MNYPLLSVIIPVYNTEIYLEKCLDSILGQSYPNIEVIVVDDASPGNTKQILGRYKENENVHYVRRTVNSGLFHARLDGLERATGDYIAFVDSDDYVSSDFYRPLLEEAEKGNFDIVAGSTVIEKENGKRIQYVLHDEAMVAQKLYGEDVRNTFYQQEGTCYSWHTVWNKVYKKTLWDKCLPEYKRIKTHLIMTEDIAFSSVLFYKAESFSAVRNDAYFYCQHTGASTDSGTANLKKITKNIGDIATVFDFLQEFLKKEKASQFIFEHYDNFRMRYYRMWNNLFKSYGDTDSEKQQLKKVLNKLRGDLSEEKESKNTQDNPFYFDAISANWYDGLEQIKAGIDDESIDVVSFDIFDTLLLRPLWNPEDIFKLMQGKFEEEFPEDAGISFKKLRRTAEVSARACIGYMRPGNEDVNLHEIYTELGNMLNCDVNKISKLEAYERETEISLSQPRKTGIALFEYAKFCHKRVVLISDMYLEKDTIEKMLMKNGISGYEALYVSSDKRALKNTGNLFALVLSELEISPAKVLHIGDNYQTDIVKAREYGMKAMFLPKGKDRFCNGMETMPTNYCASIGCLTGYSLTTWDTLFSSLGYSSMMAMVANKFFDNPFRPWNVGSDLCASPQVIGYYTVGMHLLGVGKWIVDNAKKSKAKKICFLSRDGYLPQKAFEKIKDMYGAGDIETAYVHCSRRSLLPWTIDNDMGLMDLPVEFRAHSPRSLTEMLKCCRKDLSEDEIQHLMERDGWSYKKKFVSELAYYRWLEWFRKNIFSKEVLRESKETASIYYRSMIPENAIVFDLGYSGSIMVSLQKCLGYPVKFLYIHHENSGFLERKERYGLEVETLYNFVPYYSDLIREYFLSEIDHSCIGIEHDSDGHIVPVFDESTVSYSARFALDKLQDAALSFVDDYRSFFEKYTHIMTFEPALVSMPFEGMIQNSSFEDRKIFSVASSEDRLYGDLEYISMFEFWKNQPAKEISRVHYSKPMNSMNEFFLFPYDKIKAGSRIIIYGAGKVGRDYKWQMEKTNYCEVVDIVDTNSHGKPGCKSPDRLRNVDYDYILCAVGTDNLFSEIRDRIRNINPELESKIVYVGRVNRMEL